MAASIDDYDSVLKKTLESRRKLFFQNLPAGGSATSRENKWAAYILSLSQSTTPSRTNSLDPAAAYTAEGHAPPLPKAAPEAKRRRLNTDASQHARRISMSRQHSLPSHTSGFEDGPSPFIDTGVRVPTPVLGQWSTADITKQPQAASRDLEPMAIPQGQASTARKTQAIPVQEYKPAEVFGPSSQVMSANSSSIDQTYNQSPSTLQPSPFTSSSPYSSSSGISFGVSTSPTSVGSANMTRVDSSGGTSFCNGFNMMRLNSTTSKIVPDQTGFPAESPTEVQQSLSFKPSPDVTAQPLDPVYDISETGAQFGSHQVNGAAPKMQRQMSSSSRHLYPKHNATPLMSRTPSSADGLDVIRVPSEDGVFKEAIKISPASSIARPSSEKVMCTHQGCTAQPQGFKGLHEMQRHFDRAHKEARQVYVCAPLEDDPDFLSKTNCKHCQTQKRYNEDYNAGEHLRRMHFNPKQPKSRRGHLKPEEKRGGKGGGTEPPMMTLRNYMVTFEVDVNGVRVSDPRRVNSSSNLIMPTISDSCERPADNDQAISISSSSPIETDLEYSSGEYGYTPVPMSLAQVDVKPRFASSGFSDLEQGQLGIAIDLINKAHIVGVSNTVEDPLPFDPNDSSVNDPMLFDASPSENPATYNDELAELFPSLSQSSLS